MEKTRDAETDEIANAVDAVASDRRDPISPLVFFLLPEVC